MGMILHSGQDYFEARKPCDPTQIGRFRTAIGETGVAEILARTVNTAVALKAITPKELGVACTRDGMHQ